MTTSRRAFLGGVALLGLAACGTSTAPGKGSSGRASGSGSAAAAGLRWTDARGRTVRLTKRPTRVVAQSSAAATLLDNGFHVRGVYGELGKVDGKLSYQAGSLDPATFTTLGTTYGQFDVEKYAALRPDLLIDLSFDDKTLWYVPQNVTKQVESLAPTIAVKMTGYELPQIIDEFLRLSAQLGADTKSAQLTAAKSSYDAAVAAVRTAAADKPGLRVVAVSREQRSAYFADAARHPDLAQLKSLGVHFPTMTTKPGEYFEQISWEQIGRYPADVVIYDAREAAAVTAAVRKIRTWTELPAVRAGQVYPWYPAAPYSYRAYGPLYQDVANWLRRARVLDQA